MLKSIFSSGELIDIGSILGLYVVISFPIYQKFQGLLPCLLTSFHANDLISIFLFVDLSKKFSMVI